MKELRKLRKQAEAQGWRFVERKNAWLAYSPDGETIVTIHLTSSDHRAMRNTIAQMRKGGFTP